MVLKRADEPAYQEPEYSLQQCLPLAVLKRYRFSELMIVRVVVATVPTVCGMRRRVPAEERSDDEDRTSLVPD